MVIFLGWLIMLLSLISWVNAIILVNLLARHWDFPVFTFIYFMFHFAVILVLLKTSIHIIGINKKKYNIKSHRSVRY